MHDNSAAELLPARYMDDRFEWAAPGDQQEDAWIVRFCDKDCGEAIFTGPNAEREAWEYYNRYAPAFNIYVFRLARLADDQLRPQVGLGREEIASALFKRREPETPWSIAKQHGDYSDIASVRDACLADADAILALFHQAGAGEGWRDIIERCAKVAEERFVDEWWSDASRAAGRSIARKIRALTPPATSEVAGGQSHPLPEHPGA